MREDRDTQIGKRLWYDRTNDVEISFKTLFYYNQQFETKRKGETNQ